MCYKCYLYIRGGSCICRVKIRKNREKLARKLFGKIIALGVDRYY